MHIVENSSRVSQSIGMICISDADWLPLRPADFESEFDRTKLAVLF